jgi:recombination protein RecR
VDIAPHAETLTRLIAQLRRLPGIGQRGAERIAYHLLNAPRQETLNLADAIRDLQEKTLHCGVCGNLTDTDPCRICNNPKRDVSHICVVELPRDVAQIEKTGEHEGLYHVLMGRVSSLEGIEPEHLRIAALIDRLKDGTVKELILATSPNVDGDHTALQVREAVRRAGLSETVSMSELARGIPVGTEIEFIDGAILGQALRGRKKLQP